MPPSDITVTRTVPPFHPQQLSFTLSRRELLAAQWCMRPVVSSELEFYFP